MEAAAAATAGAHMAGDVGTQQQQRPHHQQHHQEKDKYDGTEAIIEAAVAAATQEAMDNMEGWDFAMEEASIAAT